MFTIHLVRSETDKFIAAFEASEIPKLNTFFDIDGKIYKVNSEIVKWFIKGARGGIFKVNYIKVRVGQQGVDFQ